jgi:Na+-driven multidrug efflux pump
MMQGMIFLFLIAAILLTLSYFFSGDVMRIMISSEVIWEATMTYLNWRMIGFFFDTFNVMFRAFYVGIIRTKVLMANAIILAVANVILDYLLIFGKFGLGCYLLLRKIELNALRFRKRINSISRVKYQVKDLFICCC